jgi:hypothetical protein
MALLWMAFGSKLNEGRKPDKNSSLKTRFHDQKPRLEMPFKNSVSVEDLQKNQTFLLTNDQKLFYKARDQWFAPHGTAMDDLWAKVFPNLMSFANWPIVRPHNSKRAL